MQGKRVLINEKINCMTTKPPPILLIHGTVGSKMLAKSRISPYTEDAWVNSQIIPRMMMATKVANDLWCTPNPDTMWVESHVAKYVDVKPYPGLEGARRLFAIRGLERMLRNRRIGYYYETMLQWFKKYCGYEEGITIDAFSYDWRQEIGHPRLQADLRQCIKDMRRRNDDQKLTVIAHSLGGLVVQAYMQTYPDWNEDISRFVAISVPFDGVGGYSISGFLTGYCLRLPIPTSCGRGIQGSSGSIVSMAGRPGNSSYSSGFISTNIYVKRLRHPRHTDNDSRASDCITNNDISCTNKNDAHAGLATIIKDTDVFHENFKMQSTFKIHLDIAPYKKTMPNLAFCLLEKIQRNPSLLTKDVENSLTLLQNCCHKNAVKIEINGSVRPRKRRRKVIFPEYAFNRATKKIKSLATPEEIGVVCSLHDSRYRSALTKIVEDVTVLEEGVHTTIVEVPSSLVPSGQETAANTLEADTGPNVEINNDNSQVLQRDTSTYQLDISSGSLRNSVKIIYENGSLTIPHLLQLKERIGTQKHPKQAVDFTSIMDSLKENGCVADIVENTEEADPEIIRIETDELQSKAHPLQLTPMSITKSNFQLVNGNGLSVIHNQHEDNPIYSWECYSPWISYSNEHGSVISQEYEAKKLTNIFSHPDFTFKGNTVTIKEDSDFMTFYKETSGGFHGTTGRVIRWSEYPHLLRYSEITMLMDELAAEYESIPHHINYNGRILKAKKCILNYPDLPKLKKEKKVKKVDTGEPKHLSKKGTLSNDVTESILSARKKMDPSALYVKERVPSAYAKTRRLSTDTRSSVAERFMSCHPSSSSSISGPCTDIQSSQEHSFVNMIEEDDSFGSDTFTGFTTNSCTEETDNLPSSAESINDFKCHKTDCMRRIDSASSTPLKTAIKIKSHRGSQTSSLQSSRCNSLSFSDRASDTMECVPSAEGLFNLGFANSPSKKDKDKDHIILVPYANPWSDLTLRKSVTERSIAELIDKVSVQGSLDALVFPKFDQCWEFSAKRQAKPIVYPDNPKDFRYISLLTYGRQTPIHVVYPKPVEEYSELLDQIPTFVTGQGDGTVILSSMLNDGIPDQYVDDRIVDYGVSHFNILHNFATFARIASFMGLSLAKGDCDQSMFSEEESSDENTDENTIQGAFSGVIKNRNGEFAFYLIMFSHSRESTAANTRILRTFTLTGDDQGILGGFFRVIVNAIEIHGGDHFLVQAEIPGDHTPAAETWYNLLQSVCDNSSADDVLLSLAPLVSHLNLAPIKSAEQHENVVSKLVHSLPETLRTNMFDHGFRCNNCRKLSYHTLLNFLRFDTSGAAVLNFNVQSIACPLCSSMGSLTVVQRPLLSVSTNLSTSSFPINQHQQLAPDYRVYNTAFMSSKIVDDSIENTGRHMESYTVFINTQDRRGPNDDYVLYSFMGSTLRAEATDKVSELTFLKTKKVSAYREGIPGNQLRQRIGPCRIVFYMDTKTFAPELRKQLAIPPIAPRQEYVSPIYPPIPTVQHTPYSDAEPLKPDTPAPMNTLEYCANPSNMPLVRRRYCYCCTCPDSDCTTGCCRHLQSEAEECCNCVDDDTCCGRHLLLWIIITIMAVLLFITFVLVICLYAQINSTLTVRNLVVSNLSVLGPSAVTTMLRVKAPKNYVQDTFASEAQKFVLKALNHIPLDAGEWMDVSLEDYKDILIGIRDHCQATDISKCPVTESLINTLDEYVESQSLYERASRYPSFYPRKGEILKEIYLSSVDMQSKLWDMLNAKELSSIFVTAPPAACPNPTIYSCNVRSSYLKTSDLDMQMTNVQATFQDLTINGKFTAKDSTFTTMSVTGNLDVKGPATMSTITGLTNIQSTAMTATTLTATTITGTTATIDTHTVTKQLNAAGTATAGPYNLVVDSTGAVVKKKLDYQDGASKSIFSVGDAAVTINSDVTLPKAITITNSEDVVFKAAQTAIPKTYSFTDNTLKVNKSGAATSTTITDSEINTPKIVTKTTSNSVDDLCITNSIKLCPTGANQVPFLTVKMGGTAKGTIENVETATIETATVSTKLTAPAVEVSTSLSLGTQPSFDFVYAAKKSNPPGTPASLTINTVIKSGNADVIDFGNGAKLTTHVPANFTKPVTVTDGATDKIKLEPTGAITTNNCQIAITGGTANLDKTKITITPPP